MVKKIVGKIIEKKPTGFNRTVLFLILGIIILAAAFTYASMDNNTEAKTNPNPNGDTDADIDAAANTNTKTNPAVDTNTNTEISDSKSSIDVDLSAETKRLHKLCGEWKRIGSGVSGTLELKKDGTYTITTESKRNKEVGEGVWILQELIDPTTDLKKDYVSIRDKQTVRIDKQSGLKHSFCRQSPMILQIEDEILIGAGGVWKKD